MFKLEKENAFCRDDVIYDIENSNDPEEIEALRKLDEDCLFLFGDEWEEYGLTLINESEWEDYAEEIFYEMWSIPTEASYYIDIEKWANDLRYDYTVVQLGKTDFLGRST